MKALITGITGQDGSYLAEFLLEKKYEVHGLIRRSSLSNTERIDHILDKIHLHDGDVTDFISINKIIKEINPDEVYNLAAQSHVKTSFEQPIYTIQSTGLGILNILESAKDSKIKIYQASSSEMFGGINNISCNEQCSFYPKSPYGIAKLTAHWAAVNYRESYEMFVSCGILFNHESPRRGEFFVTRKITKAVARIKLGLQDKLYLGNLDAKRDWGYAGDYVEAMWLMLQQDKPDDFVIATGECRSVRDFCDCAFGFLNMDYKKFINIDKTHERPSEVNFLLGDYSKARRQLQWTPKISFEELVRIMVLHDLELETKKIKA